MKTRKLILILICFLSLLIITEGCVTERKAYLTANIFLRILSGTWINKDYNENPLKYAKIVIYPDGRYEDFHYVFYHNTYDYKSYWGGKFITLEGKTIDPWTDSKGNIWYRAKIRVSRVIGTYYLLGKVNSTVTVLEFDLSAVKYPTEIDKNSYWYRIYYRQ